MKLEIISPEKTVFSGEVESVTLPGAIGSFTILENHAPIVSSLDNGKVIYKNNGEENELLIKGGFVEVKNNIVLVCIDGL